MNLSQKLRVYLKEAQYAFLSVWRAPAFAIPTLAFPLMFYLFFGVLFGTRDGSSEMATYLLATYGVFGVIGPAMFGFGVGLATERDEGALELKRSTPMPVSAYLLSKVAMSLLFGGVIVAGLSALAVLAAEVELRPLQWVTLALLQLSAVLPFSALGLAVGARVGAQASVAVVNVIYLPMAFLSGLWIPVQAFPDWLQRVAPVDARLPRGSARAEGHRDGPGRQLDASCGGADRLHRGLLDHCRDRVSAPGGGLARCIGLRGRSSVKPRASPVASGA